MTKKLYFFNTKHVFTRNKSTKNSIYITLLTLVLDITLFPPYFPLHLLTSFSIWNDRIQSHREWWPSPIGINYLHHVSLEECPCEWIHLELADTNFPEINQKDFPGRHFAMFIQQTASALDWIHLLDTLSIVPPSTGLELCYGGSTLRGLTHKPFCLFLVKLN